MPTTPGDLPEHELGGITNCPACRLALGLDRPRAYSHPLPGHVDAAGRPSPGPLRRLARVVTRRAR